MKHRFLFWMGCVSLAQVALAVALLPFPAGRRSIFDTREDVTLRPARVRFDSAHAQHTAAMAAYRQADGIARWQGASARRAGHVVIDSSVPAPLRRTVDSIAQLSWAMLGGSARQWRAALFVYYDSASFRLGSRFQEPYRPSEVTFALPEATDGQRCVAIVRLRRTQIDVAPSSLMGPCALYARFGPPGTQVRAWLVRGRFIPARRMDWSSADGAPPRDRDRWLDLDEPSALCLTRGGSPCLEAIGTQPSPRSHAFTPPAPPNVAAGGPFALTGGDGSPTSIGLRSLLSEMVREFGAERFQRFWSSPDTPERAFASSMGIALDAWARRQLDRTAVAPSRAAVVTWESVLWLALSVPLLLLAAGRRRERVR
jgi:hypothetical protein